MSKVAVIGDRDSIYGFASAGLEIFPVITPEEAMHTIRRLVSEGYAVLYITESLFITLEAHINEYDASPLPAIIPIPGTSGNAGVGLARVRRSVERAVGADILFGDR